MTSIVPLSPIASQSLSITLDSQRCAMVVRQLSTGMYFDLSVAGTPVVNGMICRDRVNLVREDYLPFRGRLAFIDTQGTSDPEYTGLGTRYQLVYIP